MSTLEDWKRLGLRNWQNAFLPDTAGNKYETIRKNLTPNQILDAISLILDSERFEIGDYSHVLLKNTDSVVGYVGNETLELFCPKDKTPELYRVPHKHLRRLFNLVQN